MNTVPLSGINFYKGTYTECLIELEKKIPAGTTFVATPNPEMLYDASSDETLLEVLKNAHYALPDGAGIFVAHQIEDNTGGKLLKYLLFPHWCLNAILHGPALQEKYGERITGARLTRDLIAYAAEKKIPVTIVDPVVSGDSAGDRAKKASQETIQTMLESQYPGIMCAVIISNTPPEKLPEHGIIFATHGNGKQEKLLSEVTKKHPQCGLALGVGGSIDLLTGFRQPAPKFFQRFGGEWLYRLIKNPKRHLKRVLKVIGYLHLCIQK